MTLIEDEWKKIIQDYHQRLEVLRARVTLLQKLKGAFSGNIKYENITKVHNFYGRLEELMHADASLVLGIRKNYSMLIGQIEIALNEYGKIALSLKFRENVEMRGKVISKGDILEVYRFLVDLLNFTRAMIERYLKIEGRINIERQLIHQKTQQAFEKFIEAWLSEIKEEEEIIKLYDKVINRNHRIIVGGNRNWKELAALSAGAGGLVLIGATGSAIILPLFIAAVGAFRYFLSLERVEKHELAQERAFLRELSHSKTIKAPPHDQLRINTDQPRPS